MKWTLDKELEDTAKATAGGYSVGNRKERSKSETPSADAGAPNPANPDGMSDAQVEGGALYKRGGYVPARASGKRMYAKGGMVKGKCS